MTHENNLSTLGEGVLKTSARPIKVHVGTDGDYWLCDDGASPNRKSLDAGACIRHSDTHMAEGG